MLEGFGKEMWHPAYFYPKVWDIRNIAFLWPPSFDSVHRCNSASGGSGKIVQFRRDTLQL
jgi:hypothetical protein